MIETNIGESLHRLLHAYKRALRQAYQEAGLNLAISQIRSLKVIHHAQEHNLICTPQTIADRLQRDKAQITRLTKDLLEQELIAKQAHPEDRRSQILTLTEKGSSVFRTMRQIEKLAGNRMAQGLNVDEISEFIRLADAMSENLEH